MTHPTPTVRIPDTELAVAICDTLRETLDLPEDAPLRVQDLEHLTNLMATHWAIHDLTGLQHATNLTHLDLSSNNISDISDLQGLTNLTHLGLSSNSLTDVSMLQGLTNLRRLYLSNNPIEDTSPISPLKQNGLTVDIEVSEVPR